MASGKLQALCYKAEIEKNFLTNGLAGFQLLGLQDFPGQGTALVGMLDAFWDSKPYFSANEFKRFCNSTVPLIRMKNLCTPIQKHLKQMQKFIMQAKQISPMLLLNGVL